MLKRIFSNYHSRSLTYIFDVLGILLSVKVLLELNEAYKVVASYTDIGVYVFLCIAILKIAGSYKFMLRYTSFIDIAKIIAAISLAIILYTIYAKATSRLQLRYLVLLFYFTISILVGYRILIKLLFSQSIQRKDKTPTLIFGAGTNGINAFRSLSNGSKLSIEGFIEDDTAKVGKTIEGVSVYGEKQLDKVLKNKAIEQIVISTAQISAQRKKQLLDYFTERKIKIFTLPSLEDMVGKNGAQLDLKKIRIEDLLKRDQIKIDQQSNQEKYSGKCILITGAAGSIGSEIVAQLLPFRPNKLILVDIAETPLFHLKERYSDHLNDTSFEYHVVSVLDKTYIASLFKEKAVQIVFHAAAYKHVVMLEDNPKQAILNNVLGSKNMIDLSLQYAIESFVLVSTDKAINPTNIMGLSKRIAELYMSCIQETGETKLTTTRFGNVLGSNGSVVPIFNAQIAAGGPITLTHPDITRYFMTIPEACQLVLEAAANCKGGEIFVFDMGDPVKIYDLAVNMIRLSGFIENEDIAIEITGLRPGEKLYEELLSSKETLIKSHNELIFIAQKAPISPVVKNSIEALISKAHNEASANDLVHEMKTLVPEFNSSNSLYKKA